MYTGEDIMSSYDKWMVENIEEWRRSGRRNCSWLKNVRDWTELDTSSLLRAAHDRQRFAQMVADLQLWRWSLKKKNKQEYHKKHKEKFRYPGVIKSGNHC